MDGGEGGGEAGDAAPKKKNTRRCGKNRLKYQHVGCKLQPLEATFLYFSHICVCQVVGGQVSKTYLKLMVRPFSG